VRHMAEGGGRQQARRRLNPPARRRRHGDMLLSSTVCRCAARRARHVRSDTAYTGRGNTLPTRPGSNAPPPSSVVAGSSCRRWFVQDGEAAVTAVQAREAGRVTENSMEQQKAFEDTLAEAEAKNARHKPQPARRKAC